MNTPSFQESRAAAICRAFLHVIAWLVPSVRREEWRAEWNAELWELWHRAERAPNRYPNVSVRIVTFTAGSFGHAVAEFRQEWRAELLWYETRHALRFLARNRAFTITSSLLIALGVGANTTVFTFVNAILLRAPLGVEAPNELVQLGRGGTNARDFDNWSYPLFVDLRTRQQSFIDLAAYTSSDVTIGRDEDVMSASAQLVSPNYFQLLGAPMARGRAFVEEEDETGRASVAIISDGLWRKRFALDAEIVGKSITVRGRPFRIVGVARPEFTGADVGAPPPDLWIPIAAHSLIAHAPNESINNRFISWIWIVGRLKPDVSALTAQAELSRVFRQLQLDLDGTVRDGILVIPGLSLRPEERALASVISVTLLAIVCAVLLIACANFAALLLARGAARQTEISIRLAIGASRSRVVRQLVIETMIVAVVGSASAFFATRWTARLVELLMPHQVSVSLRPDLRVLAFALLLGIGTSAVFGALPAWRSASVDLLSLLRTSTPSLTRRGVRVRSALLIGQIALSFSLLGSTGLLVRTVLRANTLDPGFRADNILVGTIDLQGNTSPLLQQAHLEQIVARIGAEPGVVDATLASAVPTTGTQSSRTMWPADDDMRVLTVSTFGVDTGYFHVMGVPILYGRQFDATLDRPGTVTGLIINETLARRAWPGQDAIGKKLAYGLISGEQLVPVVGVARDSKNRSLRAEPAPQVYLLLSQNPAARVMVHVRTARGQAAMPTRLAQSIREVAPGAPVVHFESMRAHLARGFAEVRLIGALGAAFGVLALALATVGIYGVVSFETARRTREYGLRLALGARPTTIHLRVLAQFATLGAAGIILGLITTLALGPLLRRWVFGIAPFDPLTLTTVALLLTFTTAAAAFGPALRAARSDPMSSLRAD